MAVTSTGRLWWQICGGSITLGGRNGASQVALVVKNPPASAGDVRDEGSIPGPGKALEEGVAIHGSVLAVNWTEEPGGLWSIGLHRVRQA